MKLGDIISLYDRNSYNNYDIPYIVRILYVEDEQVWVKLENPERVAYMHRLDPIQTVNDIRNNTAKIIRGYVC